MLWVGPCLGRDCLCEGESPKAPHWFVERLENTVRYSLVTMDELGARYEYGDHLDGLHVTRARGPGAGAGMSLPRVALTRKEAATSLGMGLTSFDQYVLPEVRVIRKGTLRLIPLADLERWADKNAQATLSRTRDAA